MRDGRVPRTYREFHLNLWGTDPTPMSPEIAWDGGFAAGAASRQSEVERLDAECNAAQAIVARCHGQIEELKQQLWQKKAELSVAYGGTRDEAEAWHSALDKAHREIERLRAVKETP